MRSLIIGIALPLALAACGPNALNQPNESSCMHPERLGLTAPTPLQCEQWSAEQRQRREMAQAARQADEEQQRRQQEAQAKAEADARRQKQLAAENSPNNYCKDPSTARNLMADFNKFEQFQRAGISVVDIHHLITIENKDKNVYLECHGVFQLNTGMQIEGTLLFKFNIAGEPITIWSAGPPPN